MAEVDHGGIGLRSEEQAAGNVVCKGCLSDMGSVIDLVFLEGE